MAVRINLTKTSTRDKLKKHFKHRSSAGQKKLVYIYRKCSFSFSAWNDMTCDYWLTCCKPMFHFYTPRRKHWKYIFFLSFSGYKNGTYSHRKCNNRSFSLSSHESVNRTYWDCLSHYSKHSLISFMLALDRLLPIGNSHYYQLNAHSCELDTW